GSAGRGAPGQAETQGWRQPSRDDGSFRGTVASASRRKRVGIEADTGTVLSADEGLCARDSTWSHGHSFVVVLSRSYSRRGLTVGSVRAGDHAKEQGNGAAIRPVDVPRHQ